jgi:hypothetical protein
MRAHSSELTYNELPASIPTRLVLPDTKNLLRTHFFTETFRIDNMVTMTQLHEKYWPITRRHKV